jgi:predicted nucleic acid-binding protein
VADPADGRLTVVTDTCVLINFASIARLDLLAKHQGYRFVIPDQVLDELCEPTQRGLVMQAIEADRLSVTTSIELAEIELAATLRETMGRGEAVAVAMALHRGVAVATDEGRKTRRLIVERMGASRLLTTPAVLLSCIRAGELKVHEADRLKAKLEKHRFRMSFASFADLL